jgi:hypothetical protein
MVEKMLNIA